MTHGVLQARERLMDGLPVIERRYQLAGVSTAVLEGGDGPPLVLLHGPGDTALKWLRVIPELVRRYRVIAPDLPGHGSSTVEGGKLTADQVIRWLRELLERTCQEPAVLLGHVVGGAIAARLAASDGDRIARLVLVDSLGLEPFQPAPEFAGALNEFLERPGETTFFRLWHYCAHDLERLRADMGEQWEAFVGYTLERVRSPEGQAALHQIMEHFGLPAIPAEELARIAVPTVLIWGRHDLATSLAVAERASARYGWPLHVVDDAGDDPIMEQPARFLEVLGAAMGRRSSAA